MDTQGIISTHQSNTIESNMPNELSQGDKLQADKLPQDIPSPIKKIINIKKKPEIAVTKLHIPKKPGRKPKNNIIDEESYSEIYDASEIISDEIDAYLEEDIDSIYDDEVYSDDYQHPYSNRYDEHMEQIVNVLIDIKRSIDINSQCLLKLLTEFH